MLSILRDRPDVQMVRAFGSVGRGAVRYRSDIDLAIVQETSERYVDRLESMYRLLRPRIPTDLVVYTPAEWEGAGSGDAFRRRIREEGTVLYAAPAG